MLFWSNQGFQIFGPKAWTLIVRNHQSALLYTLQCEIYVHMHAIYYDGADHVV